MGASVPPICVLGPLLKHLRSCGGFRAPSLAAAWQIPLVPARTRCRGAELTLLSVFTRCLAAGADLAAFPSPGAAQSPAGSAGCRRWLPHPAARGSCSLHACEPVTGTQNHGWRVPRKPNLHYFFFFWSVALPLAPVMPTRWLSPAVFTAALCGFNSESGAGRETRKPRRGQGRGRGCWEGVLGGSLSRHNHPFCTAGALPRASKRRKGAHLCGGAMVSSAVPLAVMVWHLPCG